MSLFTDGMPIYIILLIALAIVFVYILRKSSGFRSKLPMSQITYLKLGLYATVLLFFFVVHFFISFDNLPEESEASVPTDIPRLHENAYDGKLSERADEFLAYEKEFTLANAVNTLNIQSIVSGQQWFSIHVLIEEKSESDEVVEAFLYQTPSFFAGLEVTQDIPPYEVEMHSGVLAITAKDARLSYASFQREFPFKQFQKNHTPMFEEEVISGEQLIYLRVPKGVKTTTNEDMTLLYDVR